MNDTHFKSAQNLFFLKDTVEILSSPPSILLGSMYFGFWSISENPVSIFDLEWRFALGAVEPACPNTRVFRDYQTCHAATCPRRH